jgi:hypothetical protein
MATSGDFFVATSGDFNLAVDSPLAAYLAAKRMRPSTRLLDR